MIRAHHQSAAGPDSVCRPQPDDETVCGVDGVTYTAASPFALARALVAAGIPEQALIVAGTTSELVFDSLHAAAGWEVADNAAKTARIVRLIPPADLHRKRTPK